MKAFDAGCGDQEFAQVFVKDEFYESFEAPKFHDFTRRRNRSILMPGSEPRQVSSQVLFLKSHL